MNVDAGEFTPEIKIQKEPIAWDALGTPLTLKAADEGGAFFTDDSDGVWYLNLTEMTYRPMTPSDLPAERLDHYRPYELPEATYAEATEAAMRVRAKHLEEQLKTLAIIKTKEIQFISEGLEEELGLINAYLREADPTERGRLRKDLNEMYQDMRGQPESRP